MSDLVAQLRDRRRALRLSQREVGERMNLVTPQQRIGQWERGARIPTADNLAAWAAALGAQFTLTSAIVLDTHPEGE